jgi:hypothetical protein
LHDLPELLLPAGLDNPLGQGFPLPFGVLGDVLPSPDDSRRQT